MFIIIVTEDTDIRGRRNTIHGRNGMWENTEEGSEELKRVVVSHYRTKITGVTMNMSKILNSSRNEISK